MGVYHVPCALTGDPHSLPLEMFVHPLESALLVAKSAKHVKCDESAAKKTAELVFACFMCIHGGSCGGVCACCAYM